LTFFGMKGNFVYQLATYDTEHKEFFEVVTMGVASLSIFS